MKEIDFSTLEPLKRPRTKSSDDKFLSLSILIFFKITILNPYKYLQKLLKFVPNKKTNQNGMKSYELKWNVKRKFTKR